MAGDDLPEMVFGMDPMETAPFFWSQRPQQRMFQDPHLSPEAALGIF